MKTHIFLYGNQFILIVPPPSYHTRSPDRSMLTLPSAIKARDNRPAHPTMFIHTQTLLVASHHLLSCSERIEGSQLALDSVAYNQKLLRSSDGDDGDPINTWLFTPTHPLTLGCRERTRGRVVLMDFDPDTLTINYVYDGLSLFPIGCLVACVRFHIP